MDRRAFLHTALTAAAAARTRDLFAAPHGAASPGAASQAAGAGARASGASDRVRVAIIGCGSRGNQVATDWMKHADTQFIAACDVAKSRLDQTAARLGTTQGNTLDTVEDYRRILDRKDVDAVLIATPDHWHSPMTVDACAAGKDVYVEKPVSNEIEPAVKMVEAARKHNRIVQVGLQQRSWHHFQEAAKLFQDGGIGKMLTHVVMSPPGGGGGRPQPPEEAQAPPADLNWEMFQGPAKRKAYLPSRQRNWRGYWDYGGGTMTDWGVHLTDVMLWYMQADTKTPLLTSASAQYIRTPRNPERAPDTFSVTWQFDTFVATLTNAVVPGAENATELYGNYFFADRGVLLVNRLGYEVKPYPRPAPRPGAGTGGQVVSQPAAPPMPEPPPPAEAKKVKDSNGMSEIADSQFGSATHRHVRNFLDCVKSRQTPVCDIAVGFNSSLPCLLAVHAIKLGQTIRWDGKSVKT